MTKWQRVVRLLAYGALAMMPLCVDAADEEGEARIPPPPDFVPPPPPGGFPDMDELPPPGSWSDSMRMLGSYAGRVGRIVPGHIHAWVGRLSYSGAEGWVGFGDAGWGYVSLDEASENGWSGITVFTQGGNSLYFVQRAEGADWGWFFDMQEQSWFCYAMEIDGDAWVYSAEGWYPLKF